MNRKPKQPSPRAQCIKNSIILFSIVSVCMAWSYLIYESLHHSNPSLTGANNLPIPPNDISKPVGSIEVPIPPVTVPVRTPPPVVPVPKPPPSIAVTAPKVAKLDFENIHFIHIPKCGGTSMSAVLRQVMCQRDPQKNEECCTNPGFCDFHAHRRCPVIKGCINHFPHRPLIFKPMPSIAIFRHPVARLISAYFYRGHSPNNDFFQVRPEFKEIREGKRPKVSFREYLDIHEYNNIMTRMLGADSFPYRNVTVDEKLYQAAVKAVDNIFFVGIQEAYEFSVEILLREFDMKLDIELPTERQDLSNKKLKRDKDAVKNDQELMARAAAVNSFDMRLYKFVLKKFCKFQEKYPDFIGRLKEKRISCDV